MFFIVQADSETDEVYVQMTLQPVNKVCKMMIYLIMGTHYLSP